MRVSEPEAPRASIQCRWVGNASNEPLFIWFEWNGTPDQVARITRPFMQALGLPTRAGSLFQLWPLRLRVVAERPKIEAIDVMQELY